MYTFLQTVIKELNLKFKTKEKCHGIKRETIIMWREASSENNREDGFGGSDDYFLSFCDE
jgi:hypothetical protein